MGERRNLKPEFKGNIFGYNKMEVDDYVKRTESELDMLTTKQEKWELQMNAEQKETERLRNIVENTQAEKEELLEKNDQLNAAIRDLEKELWEIRDENARLKKELEERSKKLEDSDLNTELIKEAILSAQRMKEIVIGEAHQTADEIVQQAEAERLVKEEEGRQAVQDAKKHAFEITENAKEKCNTLLDKYEEILRDVSTFKTQMMGLYRRHEERIQELPDNTEKIQEVRSQLLPVGENNYAE